MTDKNKIRERVQALLSKTEENGCTKEEAMAAAEKARSLIEKHQIDIGEEGVREEGVVTKQTKRTAGAKRLYTFTAFAISKYTETFCYIHTTPRSAKNKGSVLKSIGNEDDADLAVWLAETLLNTFEKEWRNYRFTPEYRKGCEKAHGRALRTAFQDAFCDVVSQRLRELVEQRQRAQEQAQGTGTELVVVKDALIEQYKEQSGLKLSKASFVGSTQEEYARQAGARAGRRADLHKGKINAGA